MTQPAVGHKYIYVFMQDGKSPMQIELPLELQTDLESTFEEKIRVLRNMLVSGTPVYWVGPNEYVWINPNKIAMLAGEQF